MNRVTDEFFNDITLTTCPLMMINACEHCEQFCTHSYTLTLTCLDHIV